VILGYYAGKAKFNYANRSRILLTGFLLATFFHGLYDACLFLTKYVDKTTGFVLAMAAFTTHIVAIMLAARLIKQHRHISRSLHHHTPALTIRNATEKDLPLIRTLARQVWPQTYEKLLSRKQISYMMKLIYSEASLAKQMADGHQFLLVYNAAIPVGFASFSETSPTVFKLEKIYLLQNQQGRGAGRFTIEQVIAAIQPQGATALQLNVNRHNNKAKIFYEKIGFTVISEVKIDIGSGFYMDDYVMEKKLPAIVQTNDQ
jgi:diamine N-acetyltransferase